MNPSLINSTKAQNNKSSFSSLKGLLASKPLSVPVNPYVSTEFQDYGCILADKLGDSKYRSLYIKLAKTYPRSLLEQAYSFVADYPNASNKGKLFMWKLKQIRLATKL